MTCHAASLLYIFQLMTSTYQPTPCASPPPAYYIPTDPPDSTHPTNLLTHPPTDSTTCPTTQPPFLLQLPLSEPWVPSALETFETMLAHGQPWLATEMFIMCVRDVGRGVLDVAHRDGDPTGVWLLERHLFFLLLPQIYGITGHIEMCASSLLR